MYEKLNNYLPDELIPEPTYLGNNNIEIMTKLREAMTTGEILYGFCRQAKRDGTLVIDLADDVTGLIPRAEVTYKVEKDGLVHKGICQRKVGLNVPFIVKIISVDNNGGFVVDLSRKEAVEKIKKFYKDNLKKGVVVKGIITGFQEYGAFIDIGGDIEGLLGTPEISRTYIEHPSQVFRIGQTLDVLVIDFDPDNFKVRFSRKELLPTWEEIHDRYKKGDVVLGTLKNSLNTGFFIQLDEAFEGVADFPTDGRRFKNGDKVRVRINSIDDKREKIKLKIL